MMWADCRRDVLKGIVKLAKITASIVIAAAIISVLLPSTKQVAMILGLRAVTSPEAEKMAGTAGIFVEQWMQDQLDKDKKKASQNE